jgi:hypothetical protein
LAYDSNLQSFVNTFTLPTTDGTADQVLKTDGAGNISFATASAGATELNDLSDASTANSGLALGTTNTLQYQAVLVGPNASGGDYGVAIGTNASATGDRSVAIGIDAGRDGSGDSSIAIGRSAMGIGGTTSGNENIGIGNYAAAKVTTGTANTVVGARSGREITTGSWNVVLGREAAWSGTNDLTTGSNNIIVGYQAEASSATVSNEITLGNSSITRFRIPGIQSGASDGDVMTYNSTSGTLELQTPSSGGVTQGTAIAMAMVFGG